MVTFTTTEGEAEPGCLGPSRSTNWPRLFLWPLWNKPQVVSTCFSFPLWFLLTVRWPKKVTRSASGWTSFSVACNFQEEVCSKRPCFSTTELLFVYDHVHEHYSNRHYVMSLSTGGSQQVLTTQPWIALKGRHPNHKQCVCTVCSWDVSKPWMKTTHSCFLPLYFCDLGDLPSPRLGKTINSHLEAGQKLGNIWISQKDLFNINTLKEMEKVSLHKLNNGEIFYFFVLVWNRSVLPNLLKEINKECEVLNEF